MAELSELDRNLLSNEIDDLNVENDQLEDSIETDTIAVNELTLFDISYKKRLDEVHYNIYAFEEELRLMTGRTIIDPVEEDSFKVTSPESDTFLEINDSRFTATKGTIKLVDVPLLPTRGFVLSKALGTDFEIWTRDRRGSATSNLGVPASYTIVEGNNKLKVKLNGVEKEVQVLDNTTLGILNGVSILDVGVLASQLTASLTAIDDDNFTQAAMLYNIDRQTFTLVSGTGGDSSTAEVIVESADDLATTMKFDVQTNVNGRYANNKLNIEIDGDTQEIEILYDIRRATESAILGLAIDDFSADWRTSFDEGPMFPAESNNGRQVATAIQNKLNEIGTGGFEKAAVYWWSDSQKFIIYSGIFSSSSSVNVLPHSDSNRDLRPFIGMDEPSLQRGNEISYTTTGNLYNFLRDSTSLIVSNLQNSSKKSYSILSLVEPVPISDQKFIAQTTTEYENAHIALPRIYQNGNIIIDGTNDGIDVDEGSGEVTRNIDHDTYTESKLANKIEDELNVSSVVYTVIYDTNIKKFVITADSSVTFLFATGANKNRSIATHIGFDNTSDLTGASFTSDAVTFQSGDFFEMNRFQQLIDGTPYYEDYDFGEENLLPREDNMFYGEVHPASPIELFSSTETFSIAIGSTISLDDSGSVVVASMPFGTFPDFTIITASELSIFLGSVWTSVSISVGTGRVKIVGTGSYLQIIDGTSSPNVAFGFPTIKISAVTGALDALKNQTSFNNEVFIKFWEQLRDIQLDDFVNDQFEILQQEIGLYSRISTSDTTYNNKVAALANLEINRDSLLQLEDDNAIMNIRSDTEPFVFNTDFTESGSEQLTITIPVTNDDRIYNRPAPEFRYADNTYVPMVHPSLYASSVNFDYATNNAFEIKSNLTHTRGYVLSANNPSTFSITPTQNRLNVKIDGTEAVIFLTTSGSPIAGDDVAADIETKLQAIGTGGFTRATCRFNDLDSTDKFIITSGTYGLTSTVSVSDNTVVITSSNNKLDFEETISVELTATISNGFYDGTSLATEIRTQLNAVGSSIYTVSYTANKITILSDGGGGGGILNLLLNSGSNSSNSIASAMGFIATDRTGLLSYIGDTDVELNGAINELNYSAQISVAGKVLTGVELTITSTEIYSKTIWSSGDNIDFLYEFSSYPNIKSIVNAINSNNAEYDIGYLPNLHSRFQESFFPILNSEEFEITLNASTESYTFAGASGTSISSSGPIVSLAGGETLSISINGESAQTITLLFAVGGDQVAKAIEDEVRKLQAITDSNQPGYTDFTCIFSSGVYTLTSGTLGTGSSINVIGGTAKAGLKLGSTEASGTGDCVNNHFFTIAELVAAASFANVDVLDDSGFINISAKTATLTNELKVEPSVLATKLGYFTDNLIYDPSVELATVTSSSLRQIASQDIATKYTTLRGYENMGDITATYYITDDSLIDSRKTTIATRKAFISTRLSQIPVRATAILAALTSALYDDRWDMIIERLNRTNGPYFKVGEKEAQIIRSQITIIENDDRITTIQALLDA